MRIAVLSAAKSIHTVRWVNAFAQSGHAVALYSMPEHRAKPGAYDRDVQVHYLSRGGVAGYWLGGGELKGKLKEFHPDVLNAHYATGYGTLARRSGFHPLLLSIWGSDVYDFPEQSAVCRWILRKNLKNATAVASTGWNMAERVKRYYFGDKPIYITPFGVDTGVFRCEERPATENITIGIVKTLEPKYGVEYLIRAFALLRKRIAREGRIPADGLRLEIYGGGSQLDRLKSLAKELRIDRKVTFAGHIAHARVPEVLSRFDIFCAPSVSDSESFGVAAVEAMACGVPVVVSDVDGFREVVKDRETGFIVPRRDAATLSNKLYDLVCDPLLRRRMGSAGREHVRENYEWRRCVCLMEEALAETAGKEG